MVVPGGVDPSGEYRVIPALLALIARLARAHDLRVFALRQEKRAARWSLLGATIENIGRPLTVARAVMAIRRAHACEPFDLIHCIWGGDSSLAGVHAARSIRRPALVHLAGGELVALNDIGYGGRLNPARRWLDEWTLRRADCVTAASRPIIESAAALGIRARRVPLGVDLAKWPPLAPRRRTGPARLIHVASLNRVKDQATLIGALRLLAQEGHDFHVDIVGEDLLGGQVQSLVHSADLDGRVTFHGFLTQPQIRPLMEAAHLNLISSRHEAGPLVLLEAAVVGVPTVGTAVGHLVEWAPEAAGAVSVGQPALLAAAIARVLEDEGLRLSQAQAAARRALSEDADRTASQFTEIYRELVG